MSKKQLSAKSKLFKLREWLTVSEAARHLSIMFDEEVSDADILRLALDGHLKLSVNFLTPTYGKCGKIFSFDDEEDLPQIEFLSLCDNLTKEQEKQKVQLISCLKKVGPFPGYHLQLDDKVTAIEGLWDLPLICGQQYYIEHEYQFLTGGPEVTSPIVGAAYVAREGREVCRLHEFEDENLEYETAQGKKTLDPFYYPAVALPSDSVLVVRTQELINLQKRLLMADSQANNSLDTRKERTYLNIIGSLLEVVTGTFKDKNFSSETQLREFIGEKFDDLHGVSPRTLAEKFALAKKALNGELD